MTEIESLHVKITKLKEVKSNAAKEHQFELSATLRDKEKNTNCKSQRPINKSSKHHKICSFALTNYGLDFDRSD